MRPQQRTWLVILLFCPGMFLLTFATLAQPPQAAGQSRVTPPPSHTPTPRHTDDTRPEVMQEQEQRVYLPLVVQQGQGDVGPIETPTATSESGVPTATTNPLDPTPTATATTPPPIVSDIPPIDMSISLYNNPVTADERAPYEQIVRYFADGIYEQSNGIHTLGEVTFYGNSQRADTADIRWVQRCHPAAFVSGRLRDEWYIAMCDIFSSGSIDIISFVNNTDPRFGDTDVGHRHGGYVLAHEMGHYYYSLYDEYALRAPPTVPVDPNRPNNPSTNDSPVELSIMNAQGQAVNPNDPNAFAWLNFSTVLNNTGNTAQHRVYRASAWETLSRPVTADPRSGLLNSLPPRIYYPELADVAPAAGQPPRIDLPAYAAVNNPGNPARDNLRITWSNATGLAQGTPNTIRQLVIDISATAGMTRVRNLVFAARWLNNQILTGNALGVVTVDGADVTVVQPITVIDSFDTRAAIDENLQQIAMGSAPNANVSAALRRALDEVTAFTDPLSDTVSSNVYLFAGSPLETTLAASELITEYVESEVGLYTFGYGVDEASADTLQRMAWKTTSKYYIFSEPSRQNDLTLLDVAQAITQAGYRTTPRVETRLTSGRLTIEPGIRYTNTFLVDSSLDQLLLDFLQRTTETGNVALVSPSGQRFTIRCNAGKPGAACPAALPQQGLETGEWQFEIQANSQPIDLFYQVMGVPANDMAYSAGIGIIGGDNVSFPAPVVVEATLKRDLPISGAGVTGTVTLPDGFRQPLTLRDDGVSPDAVENDGTYSGSLFYRQPGIYDFRVIFDNRAGTAIQTDEGLARAPTPDGEVFASQTFPIEEDFVRIAELTIGVFGETSRFDGEIDLPADNTPQPGIIESPGDTDLYRIQSPISGTLAFRIEGMSTEMQPRLRLLAANGDELAVDQLTEPGLNAYLFITRDGVQVDDTLFMEVAHISDTAVGGSYFVSAGPPLEGELGSSS